MLSREHSSCDYRQGAGKGRSRGDDLGGYLAASSFTKPALYNDAEVLRQKIEVFSDEKDTGKAFLNVLVLVRADLF